MRRLIAVFVPPARALPLAPALMLALALPLASLTARPALAAHELEGRDIDAGRIVYADNCAACHGENLEGQDNWQQQNADGTWPAPPHDASGHTWHHDNLLLFQTVKLGGQGALALRGITNFTSGMPAFHENLSDEDIWNVLAFIRSTWPERERMIQDGRNPPHN